MTVVTPNKDSYRVRTRGRIRSIGVGVSRWVRLVPTMAMCCAVLLAQPTLAADVVPLNVTVRSMDDAGQHISLPVGKSVLLDVDQPMTRASVAVPTVADVVVVTPKQALLTGQSVGTTQIILWGESGQQRIFDVSVELELNQLNAAIEHAVPGARVEARSVLDTIVLTGTVPSAEAAERVQQIAEVFTPKVNNQLNVAGTHQVLIRCTVAEVSRRATRQLAVNGWIAGDNVRDMFVVNQLDQVNPVNIGAGPTGNILQSGGLLFATDEQGLVLRDTPTLSLGFPRVQMQLFFSALRENGLVRVLAEPNLVAIAGQEASFLAGGEIPVPVPQASSGGVTITIEWKEFGIRLNFTPTPVGRDMVRLRVAPEISELDFTNAVTSQGFQIPAVTQRKAETTVELANGSTIAIAGLLSEQVRAFARKVPGLGDVPVLGSLFSSVRYQQDETELVILVTPELATAMNPDQVAPMPGQFMTPPNDWQLFGLGLLEGEPAPDPDARELVVKTDEPVRARKWEAPPTQMSLHGPWGLAEEVETQ